MEKKRDEEEDQFLFLVPSSKKSKSLDTSIFNEKGIFLSLFFFNLNNFIYY